MQGCCRGRVIDHPGQQDVREGLAYFQGLGRWLGPGQREQKARQQLQE
ncbi:hypothetical protein GCM10028895_51230 [Pontibacter rugosus]